MVNRADELLRRIGALKRVIRKLTRDVPAALMTEKDLADMNTLEEIIRDYGGQVQKVPYSNMEREWCEAKYISDMADYDETHL
jgi:hypothetical protein